MKKFDLNIQKVLEDWEPYHAIREVIANALDEQALTNSEDIKIFRDKQGCWHIRDFGRGLKYEHLTQNENEEKLQSQYLIGKFGVGLKDALATFDRRKIKVLIKSPYGDISLGKSRKHDFEDIVTLHAYVAEPSGPHLVGTEFILEGCKAEDIEKAKNLFLKFSGDVILEGTRYGEVLEKKGTSASIYINGVRVAEEENFLYSYNITSLTQAIKKALNRERTNVGRSAYSDRIKTILLASKTKEVANGLVEDLKGFETGLIHDELNWSDVSVHACKLLNSLEKVVFLTAGQLMNSTDMVDRARADGYSVVTVPNTIGDKIAGQTDISGNRILDLHGFTTIWNDSFEFKFVDIKELNGRERKIFEKTDAIFKLVGGRPRKVKQIKISETMRMESFALTEATGLWEELIGRIIIKRSELRSLEDYAGTLLHEVAHAISEERDISAGFEGQLTSFLGTLASDAVG
ncbi:MAG: ATP-binding protein [Anaerolineae bacterium]